MRDKLILVTKEDIHNMKIRAVKEFAEGIRYTHDKLVEEELNSFIDYLNQLADI